MLIENFPPTPKVSPEIAAVARQFEASFISEMLKHSGMFRTPDTFGGGAGEDAFAPMLTERYASSLAEAGGLGLSERIAMSLMQGK